MNKLITTLVTGLLIIINGHLIAQPTFYIDPADTTVNAGTQVTLDIAVTDFDNIISIQYSMNWDTAVLDFVSVSNFSPLLPGLVGGNFGTNPNNVDNGNMTVSWFDQNVSGVTLPDSSVIYSITFDVLTNVGTNITFSGDPLFTEIVDGNGVDVGFSSIMGTLNGGVVFVPEMSIFATNESGFNGSSVCLDISVEDFSDITDMAFSMNFDETIIQFDSFTNFKFTGLRSW